MMEDKGDKMRGKARVGGSRGARKPLGHGTGHLDSDL